MRIAIVINVQRFTETLKNQLASPELSEQFAITYDLFTPEPAQLEQTLKDLNVASYNAILIGGGDGTVRTALQVLASQDVPVIVLPLGTFNALARSLNWPQNIAETFAIIKNNKCMQIDLAEVNGYIIVNHAWLGFYYYILKMREKYKDKLGRSRLLKAFFNTFLMFKRLPFYTFDVEVNGKKVTYKTCLLFVSNNETTTNISNFAEKKTLTKGELAVNILNVHTRWQLFLCMFDILLRGLKHSRYTTTFSVKQISVNASPPNMKLVIDGELFDVEGPLNFVIYPKQLTILVP